jgi:prevent-host-death family protein
MANYTIHQAKTLFSKLIRRAERGEEVIILNRNTPVARLVPMERKERRLGFFGGSGEYWMAEDFDAPLEDFVGHM